MKIGKKFGCNLGDRIDIELSPSVLWDMINLCKNRAMTEGNYNFQGAWREVKDNLEKRYNEWKELRKEANKNEKKEVK